MSAGVDSAVELGRVLAFTRMTSTCNIRRKTGTSTVGGVKVATWATVYADLPCRVGAGAGTRTLDAGGVTAEVPVRVVSVPHDTSDLRDGDLVEMTGGENTGLVLRVLEADWVDQATARRLSAVGTEAPVEWST